MKEVITDAAPGNVWVNKTPRQVRWTGVDRSTPGNILILLALPSPYWNSYQLFTQWIQQEPTVCK